MSLNNYKIFNGTYTIYESDSKGKIFDAYNNMVKYEGEFLNGKRNGKGKEYHDYYGETLKLKFEGEYLKGKRNGKGKEYDENGTLIFEGEYLNGLKHGKGIEYDYLGWIMFEGDFLNGEMNKGIGKTYYLNGAIGTITEYLNGKVWSKKEYDRFGDLLSEIQEGKGSRKIYNNEDELKSEIEYIDGINIGKMKVYEKGKLKYEKEFNNDKIWNMKVYDENSNIINEICDGKGLTKIYNDLYDYLIFEGEYLNGEKNGKGKEYIYSNKIIFEGEYLNGKRNGKGKEYDENGTLIFEGEYVNGIKHGKGKDYYNKSGKLKFDGDYFYNKRINGKFYLEGELEFEGEFLFDRKYNGKGYDKNGKIIYELKNGTGKVNEYYEEGFLKFEGEYLNGRKNGKCKEYYHTFNMKKKLEFEGEYLNGIRNGKCKCYWENGKLDFDGEFVGGRKNGRCKDYNPQGELVFEGDYLNGEKIVK